jgi:HEAT repeat protein
MPREHLLGLVVDVERLLAAGAAAAVGHEGLSRRGRTLRELGQKVAALVPVADAVERVTSSSPREVGRAFLDLVVMARQLRGSLAGTGPEGPLQIIESSDSWQTPMPTRDVYNAHEALTTDTSSSALHDALQRDVTGDLRLVPSALAALESNKSSIADLVADKVLPAVGRAALPDLLAKLDLKGKASDARRLRAICKIDPKIGAELCRKGLSEGSPALKTQALYCLPDVGLPGEAEKNGLAMWKEKKKDVRKAALGALRKAAGDEALEVLVQALLEDDWPIIRQAQEVLAESPHPKATERLLREVEQRLAALTPPVPKSKKSAKKAVMKEAENAEKARYQAISVLCFLLAALGGRKDAQSGRVLKVFLHLTHHVDERLRSQAVQVLAKLGPEVKEVVPALTEVVMDSDAQLACLAAGALSQLPPEKREATIPTLIEWIRNSGEHRYLVSIVASMLPKHTDRFGDKILDLFGHQLEKNNEELRSIAIVALSEIGTPAQKHLPRILEQAKLGNASANFIEVFANIDPEGTTSIPALIELLKENKARVRANALQGLMGYRTKAQAAEPFVTMLLKDRDGLVKHLAERTLDAIQGRV